MTKIGKKAAQDFFCAVSKVFDRVKTVALWSAKKRKKGLYRATVPQLPLDGEIFIYILLYLLTY
jgi:hypothetical protein